MTGLLLVIAAAATLVASAGATDAAFPKRIDLPDGFQPEGIATAGEQLYVGSIPTGAVYRGSLRTGKGAVFVPAQAGRQAIGMDADRGRLFVAGGPTGRAFVYDARTGATLATLTLDPDGGSFINDVVVTRSAAWFTDSFSLVLYRVPLGAGGRPGSQAGVKAVALTDAIQLQSGFNVNGIDATENGKTLVIVQSNTGKLFTVNPGTGSTREINLGGQNVQNGDGILLDGHRLYVVRNFDSVVAKIMLRPGFRSGRVVRLISDPQLDVPTTIDEHGSRLYAVNARFGPPPTATTDYWITQLGK
jgi:sugar lactone lactonase YvrE